MENRNDVSSFFYYMWNEWSEKECAIAFAESLCGWRHFWTKWLGLRDKHSHFGTVEEFFAELSEYHQDMLVRRAVQVYDKKKKIWMQ